MKNKINKIFFIFYFFFSQFRYWLIFTNISQRAQLLTAHFNLTLAVKGLTLTRDCLSVKNEIHKNYLGNCFNDTISIHWFYWLKNKRIKIDDYCDINRYEAGLVCIVPYSALNGHSCEKLC